jgi:hypothetical protein
MSRRGLCPLLSFRSDNALRPLSRSTGGPENQTRPCGFEQPKQSLPQVTGLVAAVIILFTVTYTLFQRQEIRA